MAVTPTIIRMLNILLPTTLPIDSPALPSMAESTLTDNSGAEVPKATTVRPMAIEEIRNRLASADAPSVRKSAPKMTNASPAIIQKAFIIAIHSLSSPYTVQPRSGTAATPVRDAASALRPCKYSKKFTTSTARRPFGTISAPYQTMPPIPAAAAKAAQRQRRIRSGVFQHQISVFFRAVRIFEKKILTFARQTRRVGLRLTINQLNFIANGC